MVMYLPIHGEFQTPPHLHHPSYDDPTAASVKMGIIEHPIKVVLSSLPCQGLGYAS